MSADEVLCACGYMRMLDPAVSCKRGPIIHAVSHCETTCDDCRRLRSLLVEARDALRDYRAAVAQNTTVRFVNPKYAKAKFLNEATAKADAVLARMDEEVGHG